MIDSKPSILILANITNVHTHRFIRQFRENGWDVKAISIQPPNSENIKEFGDIIIRIPTHRIYSLLIKLPFFRYSEFHNINAGVRWYEPYTIASLFTYVYLLIFIKKLVKGRNADAIFAIYLTMHGFFAALSGHKNIIASAAGIDVSLHKRSSLKYWLNHPKILRYSVKRFKCLIAFDRESFEPILQAKGCRTDIAMWLNHWGVDTKKFVESKRDIINNECCRFICSRPYRKEFDMENILLAIRKLIDKYRSVEFIIASGARSEANLQELNKILEKTGCVIPQIKVLKYVSYENLPEVINQCDVYIDPINIKKNPEAKNWGVSGSLLESMACGLIPVVSNRPSVNWILPPQASPFRFNDFDVDLADALERAFKAKSDKQLRSIMRMAVLEKASWQSNIDIIEKEFGKHSMEEKNHDR